MTNKVPPDKPRLATRGRVGLLVTIVTLLLQLVVVLCTCFRRHQYVMGLLDLRGLLGNTLLGNTLLGYTLLGNTLLLC